MSAIGVIRSNMSKRVRLILLNYSPNTYFSLFRRNKNNTIVFDRDFLSILSNIIRDGTACQTVEEYYTLYRLAINAEKIEGSFAELGVYRGGGAKVLCESKGDRHLFLFDTFEGMPPTNPQIDTVLPGTFQTSLKSVCNYLSAYPNIHFCEGFFPDSIFRCPEAFDQRFALVHLDGDLYETTRSGLEFFYSRMSPGGLMIAHDYRSISCPGVKKAFDEFFVDKPEVIIETQHTQCIIVKKAE